MEKYAEPVRTTQKQKEIAPYSRREAKKSESEEAFNRAIKLFRNLPEEDFIFPANVLENELSVFFLDTNITGNKYGNFAKNAVFGCYFMGCLNEIVDGLSFSIDDKPFRTIDFSSFVENYGKNEEWRKRIEAVTGSLAGLEENHYFRCHTALGYYLEGKFLDALETLNKKKIAIYKSYIVDLQKSCSVSLQAYFERDIRTRTTQKAAKAKHENSKQAKAKDFIKEQFDQKYRGKIENRHVYDGYANKEAFTQEMICRLEEAVGSRQIRERAIRGFVAELEKDFDQSHRGRNLYNRLTYDKVT